MYNIKKHYNTKHATEFDHKVGDERKEVIERLKEDLPNRTEVNIKVIRHMLFIFIEYKIRKIG